MNSLQAKLSAGLLLSLVIIFSSLWLIVSLNATGLAENYMASRITHDIETLLNTVNFDQDGQLVLQNDQPDLVYKQPFSGHYYVISSGQQRIYSRSLWDQVLQHQNLKIGDTISSHQTGPEHQSLLVISRGFLKQQQPLTISIAEDLNPIHKNIRQFQTWFALFAFGMMLLLVVLQVFILRRSLQPLSKIRRELESLEQGKLDKLSTDTPSELQPLILEVNHLLALTAQRLRRSREASADLAHAIKKPLTVIQQVLSNSEIDASTRAVLSEQSTAIYQLSDRILKRASLSGPSYSGTAFSFTEDLPALLQTLNMMHAATTVQLTSHITPNLTCQIEREDMLELLGNVLDNAYKWARKKILLTIRSDQQLHICIEDDGPGAEPDAIQQITARGVRLDETTEGHGFGLSIAADIVAEYSGQLDFDTSPTLGGFRVTITLPVPLP